MSDGKEPLKVIAAKVPMATYEEIEKTAEALLINKNELINRAVRLYLASYERAMDFAGYNRRNT